MKTYVFPKGKAKTKTRKTYNIAHAAATLAQKGKPDGEPSPRNHVKVACNGDGELKLLATDGHCAMVADFADTLFPVDEGIYLPVIGKKEVVFVESANVEKFPDIFGYTFNIKNTTRIISSISDENRDETNIYEILLAGGPLANIEYMSLACRIEESWKVGFAKGAGGWSIMLSSVNAGNIEIYFTALGGPIHGY